MLKLQIFVTDDCWSCEESRRIAAETQARFEAVEVTLLDLQSDERPSSVFAAPTYLLNGRVISLGNPRREDLWAQLAQRNDNLGDEEERPE
ncbi:MAG TPA: hypothetical protein VK879_12495 [Candidatus Sulfomarinibacteraceae bacterium]|nr:hypothetical protein [Candidatus Sulfomarinibacteraceae bacterium]